MNRLRIAPSVIPNLFTAMNMFCGFLSVIYSSSEQFFMAGWLIILAAVFDALDGLMARLTNSSSQLGVELDSLSDIVSFGVAPAFLIYSTYLFQFEVFGIILSSLIMISGGFRLARFNVQLVGFSKSYFTGLPIPSSGITIASFVLSFLNPDNNFSRPYADFIIPMILLLTFLMVSKIKYNTFPKITIASFKEKPIRFILAVGAILILVFAQVKGLFGLFVLVILFGIFRHIYYKVQSKKIK
jgi:CDP-diacylglycerol--serine O-phosphatidyltransferase